MTYLENVKAQIKKLYETNPVIHIDISLSTPKISLKNETVTIKAVYSHLFKIEETSKGLPRCHVLQYTDLLTGNVIIYELKN